MAEGDSVLRIARRIDEVLAGERVSVRAPGQRRPAGLAVAEIDGRVLERVESRGKHLLLHFEDRRVLHSHLGMRGSWQVLREGERWRRPTHQPSNSTTSIGGSTMRIVREAQLLHDPKLARLGPDILSEDFDPAIAVARIRQTNPSLQLGEALLGQRLVAGIGNIFKSEGCFEARINPTRRLEALDEDELVEVLSATRRLMLEAVQTGRQPHRVYRAAGRPCPRCGTRIRSRAQGESARITYWCPECQPA